MSLAAKIERPALSQADHLLWQGLIQDRCGLTFGETRASALSRGLWRRMQGIEVARYGDYYRRVAEDDPAAREWLALLELLVNHETSFFRHAPSYQALRERVLPEILARRTRAGRPWLRLWSAGCSTGPEVYSLAMTALNSVAALDAGTVHGAAAHGIGTGSPYAHVSSTASADARAVVVTGSDISETALARARAGRYRGSMMRDVSSADRNRYFEPEPVHEDRRRAGKSAVADHRVGASLRDVVELVAWNAIRLETYPVSDQDIIFCQNLLMYLHPKTRHIVVEALCRCLAPGGYLFLGPGEVVGLRIAGTQMARLDSCLAYQRLP